MSLNEITEYIMTFQGQDMRTPLYSENKSGTIRIEFYNNHQNQRIYDLTKNPPTLQNFVGNGAIKGTCTNFASTVSGQNGNIECVVNVPLTAGNTPIAGVIVEFTNPNNAQYSEVYPYCEAFIASGGTTATKGQLACSRQDPNNNEAIFFISGFNFADGMTLSFTFRARAKQASSLSTNIILQGLNSDGQFYNLAKVTGAPIPIPSTVLTQTCKLFFFCLYDTISLLLILFTCSSFIVVLLIMY